MASVCCSGIIGGYGVGVASSVEFVVPAGSRTLPVDAAESFELLKIEILFAGMAMKFGAYPMLMFRLPFADLAALKSSLAKALVRHPSFAGRIHADLSNNFSGRVVLTNAGVPFTVVHSRERSAPEVLEEMSMLSFGHLPSPKKLLKGVDPVMTVKLTVFQNGSAILAICRTHALADGTYMWAVIADWARAARDEPLDDCVRTDRDPWKALYVGDIEEMQKGIEEEIGTRIVKKPFRYTMLMGLMRAMDLVFFAGCSTSLSRTRHVFSYAELDHIKRAATPPPNSLGDGWVTTQEAVAAHILLCLGRAVLSEGSRDAVTGVELWVDARTRMGLPADAAAGMGFTTVRILVEQLLEKDLWQVASVIHEQLKAFTAESCKKRMGPFISIIERGLGPEVIFELVQRQAYHPQKGKYDLVLKLNNQSKRVLPNFGSAGGVAHAVITNAGPSLLLPAPGGVELFLSKDAFMGASSLQKVEAMRLIADVYSLTPDSETMASPGQRLAHGAHEAAQ